MCVNIYMGGELRLGGAVLMRQLQTAAGLVSAVLSIYIYLYVCRYMFVFIYICICIHVCVCVCIYIYIGGEPRLGGAVLVRQLQNAAGPMSAISYFSISHSVYIYIYTFIHLFL